MVKMLLRQKRSSGGGLGALERKALCIRLLSSRYSNRDSSRCGGFSLLEIVVVLAIMGILVAIQLPNVIGNTDKAKFIAAQARLSNAITECATAKSNGATELELIFVNPKFLDIVPSMEVSPEGYKWDSADGRGCNYMSLLPVDSDGNYAINNGYPILMAKLAPGGRIVKVAHACQPYLSLDFTRECNRWDPTNTAATNYLTGRNLESSTWERKPKDQ